MEYLHTELRDRVDWSSNVFSEPPTKLGVMRSAVNWEWGRPLGNALSTISLLSNDTAIVVARDKCDLVLRVYFPIMNSNGLFCCGAEQLALSLSRCRFEDVRL